MLILAGVVVALLFVPVLGGRLSRLSDISLNARWVIVYALALQVVAMVVIPTAPRPALVALHVSSYLLAAAFVWMNRDLPGVPVMAAGAGSNALAIAANGGQMPARAEALAHAGIHEEAGKYVNSGVVAHPHLGFLGDIWATPSWLPLHNVVSIGDVLILVGGWLFVHSVCGSRLAVRPHCAACGEVLRPRWVRTPAAVPAQRVEDERQAEVGTHQRAHRTEVAPRAERGTRKRATARAR